MTDILTSVQHYVATQTILFPADLHMFFPFSVATCCLLSRPSSIVNQSGNIVATQEMLLRHVFFGNCLEFCCDTKISVATWTAAIAVFLFFLAGNLSFLN